MDLIYKIYSVFLYDHQLNHDYLILYNYGDYDLQRGLGYDIGYSLNKIHNLDKYSPSFNDESIIEMQNAAIRGNKMFVKNDGFLTLVKGGTSPRPRYNIYDVYWNETKSNINIHEYEVAAIWNVGKDSCSVYRIWEEKDERERIIRNNKLNLLLTI